MYWNIEIKEKYQVSKHVKFLSSFLSSKERHWLFRSQVVDRRVNGVCCRERDEFYSYPLLMARWFAVVTACSPTDPTLEHTRVRTDHVCTIAVYATIQTQPCPVSPVSDVAILTDPSRRYSEIYGDATVGTRDWDRVWRAWEEVRKRTKRGSNDQKTESVFRVRERMWVHMESWKERERKICSGQKKKQRIKAEIKRNTVWRKRENRRVERREEGKENSSWRPWWSR